MRVTLSKAQKWGKKKAYFVNRHGERFLVTKIEKKRPNWQLTLEDGREFLVDPSTVLEAD